MRPRRPGFILLFGSRNIVSHDAHRQPLHTVCPHCGQPSDIVSKSYRTWFTLFFLPLFPVSGARHFSQCSACGAQFSVTVDDLRRSLDAGQQRQHQEAISLYNSLRASPANSITLNQLMLMYAGMNEYDQAISAAREFSQALNASEQCMCTLGRIFLAAERRAEAMQWLDAALARNENLGEAHYYKGVALMTAQPPALEGAIASARAARSAGHPGAEALLQEAQKRASA